MAIKMTREEYQRIYGQAPIVGKTQTNQRKPGYFSRVGSDIKGAVGQASESLTASGEGRMNPFYAGANIAKNVSGAVLSPLVEAPGLKQIGEGFSKAGQAVVDTSIGQKATDWMSKQASPETLGAISDVAETGLNVAGIEGGIKTLQSVPKVISKVVSPIKPAIAGTGRILKRTGEGAYGVTVTASEGTNRAMSSYKESTPNLYTRIKNTVSGETKGKPITEANTAARYGLMGTESEIGVQSGRYMNKVWTEKVQPALAKVKGKLEMSRFWDTLEKKIRADNPELTRRNSLLEGLNDLKSEYSRVPRVGLEKLQEYKEGWTKFQSEQVWKGKPISSATKEVMKMAGDTARDFIYKYTPEGTRMDYIDYGNLKSIREAGIKSGVGDLAKKSITRGAWQFIMDTAVTPVATTMGKILYRTGEGLEFVGDSGAKTVGDIVGREMLVTQQSGERGVPITKPTQLKVKQEGKAQNKIPLYGGQTPPRVDLPTIR